MDGQDHVHHPFGFPRDTPGIPHYQLALYHDTLVYHLGPRKFFLPFPSHPVIPPTHSSPSQETRRIPPRPPPSRPINHADPTHAPSPCLLPPQARSARHRQALHRPRPRAHRRLLLVPPRPARRRLCQSRRRQFHPRPWRLGLVAVKDTHSPGSKWCMTGLQACCGISMPMYGSSEEWKEANDGHLNR